MMMVMVARGRLRLSSWLQIWHLACLSRSTEFVGQISQHLRLGTRGTLSIGFQGVCYVRHDRLKLGRICLLQLLKLIEQARHGR